MVSLLRINLFFSTSVSCTRGLKQRVTLRYMPQIPQMVVCGYILMYSVLALRFGGLLCIMKDQCSTSGVVFNVYSLFDAI